MVEACVAKAHFSIILWQIVFTEGEDGLFSKQISCPLQMKFHKEELKMKFKKALVVILALAMVVTLMPTAAFATTSNSVCLLYTSDAADEL